MSSPSDEYQKTISDNQIYDAYTCLYASPINCESNTSRTTKKSLNQIYQKYVDVKNNNTANVKQYASRDLKEAYAKALGDITYATNTENDNPYAANYNKLFDDIQQTRNELDTKLETVYNLPGSHGYEYKSHYESTIMSGVLWGTLAITMVYYVFYKK